MGLPANQASTLATTYPDYLVTAHVNFLLGGTGVDDTNMAAVAPGSNPYNALSFTEQAIDENPYTSAEAFDPTDSLAYSAEAIEAFETLVATYLTSSPSTTGEKKTLEEFISKASDLYDTYAIDIDTDIDTLVTEFEADSEDEYLRRRSSFEAGMFAINAIETSPYVIGLALIDGDRTRSIDGLRAKLLTQARRDKNIFLVQLAELMSAMQGRNAGLKQVAASLRADQSRFDYTSNREKLMQDKEYDVGEVQWELETLKSGASIIGAMQGIPLSQKGPSNLATAVSTALSIGPQVGLSIGQATRSPALGLLGGGLAALFSYGANING